MDFEPNFDNLRPTERYEYTPSPAGDFYVVVDTTTGAAVPGSLYTDRTDAWEAADALNKQHYASIAPALPAPMCGMAGWGVPHPDGGDYLADGYDSPEDATTAAQLAWVYLHRDGATREQAWQAAGVAMQDSELGEYSDYSKDLTGARCRSVEGLRHYRARAIEEQYLQVRAAQVQQAAAAA
jgi:hypothetical protein